MTTPRYNPYENRDLKHPNTFSGALIHIIKGSLGTGLFAVPRAFRNAGLVVGAIGTILVGYLCTYEITLLVSASLKICEDLKIPSLGFAETAEAVFENGPGPLRKSSKFAKLFVEIALTLTYFVGNAVYVVFISESVIKLLSYYHTPALNWEIYINLVILVLLIFFCQIRELKHIVPFSFIANVTMTLAILITGYYMTLAMIDVKISDRALAKEVTGFPSFFTTVLFAMEGIGTIMPIENSMVVNKFIGCPGVLNIAMTFVIIFYSFVGFCGYYAYGEITNAAIILNLPSDQIPAQVVQASISLAIFFTFMLQYYVPIDITWRRLKPHVSKEKQNCTQIWWRTFTVIFIVGIATAAEKHLGPLIDLLGAVFFSTLGLFIPSFLDIIVHWKNWGRCNWILLKDIFLILIYFFGLISGTYYAVLNFMEEDAP